MRNLIEDIHQEVLQQLDSNNIELAGIVTPDYLRKFDEALESTKQTYKDHIHEDLVLLLHSVESLDLQIGTTLFYLKYSINLDGNTITFTYPERYNAQNKISNFYFWHNLSLAFESIYRVWERITRLLEDLSFPDQNTKRNGSSYYYYKYLKDLKTNQPSQLYEIFKEFEKNYRDLAYLRNNYSHLSSKLDGDKQIRLLREDTIEVTEPSLLQKKGELLEHYKNLGQIINTVFANWAQLRNHSTSH